MSRQVEIKSHGFKILLNHKNDESSWENGFSLCTARKNTKQKLNSPGEKGPERNRETGPAPIFVLRECDLGLTSLPLVSPCSNHSTVTLRVSGFIPETTAEWMRPGKKEREIKMKVKTRHEVRNLWRVSFAVFGDANAREIDRGGLFVNVNLKLRVGRAWRLYN